MSLKGLIFDLDGVIVFTDQYHYKAWKQMSDEKGIYFDQEINNRLRGVSRMDSLEIILERYEGPLLSDEDKQKMAEREKYYIGLNGQIFEVSKELYETYYKGQRKEKYFTHDLKQEHTKVDKKTGEMIVIPSREDSYERLLEAEKQFAEETEKVEDVAVRAVMLE